LSAKPEGSSEILDKTADLKKSAGPVVDPSIEHLLKASGDESQTAQLLQSAKEDEGLKIEGKKEKSEEKIGESKSAGTKDK